MPHGLSATLTALALLGACSPEISSTIPPPHTYFNDALGLAFVLPSDWQEQAEPMSHIFSGPPGTDAYYTTLVLQSRSGTKLDVALNNEFADWVTLPAFAFTQRDLALADGQPALSYGVQFEYAEQLRQRTGLLFCQHGVVVDLSYNAPAPLYTRGLPVYDEVINSLVLAR